MRWEASYCTRQGRTISTLMCGRCPISPRSERVDDTLVKVRGCPNGLMVLLLLSVGPSLPFALPPCSFSLASSLLTLPPIRQHSLRLFSHLPHLLLRRRRPRRRAHHPPLSLHPSFNPLRPPLNSQHRALSPYPPPTLHVRYRETHSRAFLLSFPSFLRQTLCAACASTE